MKIPDAIADLHDVAAAAVTSSICRDRVKAIEMLGDAIEADPGNAELLVYILLDSLVFAMAEMMAELSGEEVVLRDDLLERWQAIVLKGHVHFGRAG